jgi:endonuclease-3
LVDKVIVSDEIGDKDASFDKVECAHLQTSTETVPSTLSPSHRYAMKTEDSSDGIGGDRKRVRLQSTVKREHLLDSQVLRGVKQEKWTSQFNKSLSDGDDYKTTTTAKTMTKLEHEITEQVVKSEGVMVKEEEFDAKVKIEIEVERAPNVFSLVTDEADKVVGPKNWWKIYNEIALMRRKFTSPVDNQGCERMPNTIYPNVRRNYPNIYRFQLLISLMLSSQTKDEVNFDAMVKLQTYFLEQGYKHGLCLEAIRNTTEYQIDALIGKVGFHNRKAGYIKKTAEILADKFHGDIPTTIEDVVSLPGVGPKMGYLLLQNAWNINTGIGVDVHVHRLGQLWGWTSKSTKTPEQTRVQLQEWLPEKYWQSINPLLVGFGQVVCVPKAPNCDVCSLATKKLCPGVNRKLVNAPMTEARLEKLRKQRGDLSQLIKDLID